MVFGLLKMVIRSLFGSKRSYYETLAAWKSTARLSRNLVRDARRARRFDNQRVALFDQIKKDEQDAVRDPEKRKALVARLAKEFPEFIRDIRGEIEANVRILIGTESILYQMKEQMISLIKKEIAEIRTAGFPEFAAQKLLQRLRSLEQEYERDLEDIRTMTRREFKGRFQMATFALRSEQRLEKEIKKDAKRLRKLALDYDETLDALPQAEFSGDIEKTQQRIEHMIEDLESELKLLMEIAKDDVTVMHRIKDPLEELEKIIPSLPVEPRTKFDWVNQLRSVHQFEENKLNELRLQARRLEKREGDTKAA